MHETVERPLQNFFQPLGLLAVSRHGKSGLLYWQRIIKLIHKLELIDVNFSPLSPGIGSVALSIDSYTIIDFSEKLLVCSTTHNARARVRRFRNSMIEWCGIVILLSSIEHTHTTIIKSVVESKVLKQQQLLMCGKEKWISGKLMYVG